jgi:hypothetical protein
MLSVIVCMDMVMLSVEFGVIQRSDDSRIGNTGATIMDGPQFSPIP